MIGRGWIYPKFYVRPAPAPDGYELIVDYAGFLGIEERWRFEPIDPVPVPRGAGVAHG
ncbi:protein Asterix [Falsiruegeria mediterranea]|uniref:Uncharacterized protein n=1 Tax=Falsiruegeria mediterranea M17 TaxID=1200281 RepID=A0A2R8C5B7_9RHOB|nr:protein Asterix [Falsiruegeria mediterranea]SPJ27644.1 hypothetical protein TRM7615_01134 [Falsiruegeria mediterranea M17]